MTMIAPPPPALRINSTPAGHGRLRAHRRLVEGADRAINREPARRSTLELVDLHDHEAAHVRAELGRGSVRLVAHGFHVDCTVFSRSRLPRERLGEQGERRRGCPPDEGISIPGRRLEPLHGSLRSDLPERPCGHRADRRARIVERSHQEGRRARLAPAAEDHRGLSADLVRARFNERGGRRGEGIHARNRTAPSRDASERQGRHHGQSRDPGPASGPPRAFPRAFQRNQDYSGALARQTPRGGV